MKRFFLPLALLCLSLLLPACNQKPEVATVGKPAPDFTLVDTKGKTWASWCPPCRQEMPSMQRVYNFIPEDRFAMLAILSNDEPALAEGLTAKIGSTFPILLDPEGKAAATYGLTGVPETYIIDKEGILREKFLGAVQWDSPEVMRMLMGYVGQ